MRRGRDTQGMQEGRSPRRHAKRTQTLPKNPSVVSTMDTYYYFVGGGNNAHLVRRIMSTRKQWEELVDSKQTLLSFKWQQSNRGYNYDNNGAKKIYKQMLNHFEYHSELSNKEFLYKNVLDHCENYKMNAFKFMPVTFVLNSLDANFDNQMTSFLNFFYNYHPSPPEKRRVSLGIRKRFMGIQRPLIIDRKISWYHSKPEMEGSYRSPDSQYLWILKPTSYNRGNGIHVFNTLSELEQLMNRYIRGTTASLGSPRKTSSKGSPGKTSTNTMVIQSSSFVVQKYMERPLLYDGRKFDIRIWVMLGPDLKVYLFRQGYMRTCSQSYQLNPEKMKDLGVHLTNNSVQKFHQGYNRFEKGNQLSFRALKMLLEEKGKDFDTFMGQIKEVIKVTMMSVRRKINRYERDFCFEIFGYDFMIDEEGLNPWLIEVNDNPALEESSPLLEQLLPRMLDDAFRTTIDKFFPTTKTSYSYVVDNQENGVNLWDLLLDLKRPS